MASLVTIGLMGVSMLTGASTSFHKEPKKATVEVFWVGTISKTVFNLVRPPRPPDTISLAVFNGVRGEEKHTILSRT